MVFDDKVEVFMLRRGEATWTELGVQRVVITNQDISLHYCNPPARLMLQVHMSKHPHTVTLLPATSRVQDLMLYRVYKLLDSPSSLTRLSLIIFVRRLLVVEDS